MKKKFTFLIAAIVLLTLVLQPFMACADEGDELAICQGTGSGYGTRRTLTDSHSVGWVLASGQTGYLGANSGTNHDKVKPTAADLPVVKAVNSSANTNTTGYYFYYTTTAVENVGSIQFSYTGNSGNSKATAYVVVGDAVSAVNGDAYEIIELSSTSTTAQNASLGTSGTFTYKFNETQTDARYYGFIIVTNSYKRLTAGTIKLLEGSTNTDTYTITCATDLSHGSISASPTSATAGTTITITATPESGYKLKTVTVSKSDGTVTNTISGNTATFTMPAENVTVTATFDIAFNITKATGILNGDIIIDKSTACSEETITVTPTANNFYDFGSISTTPNCEITNNGDGTYSFTMPSSDVEVNATFNERVATFTNGICSILMTTEESFNSMIAISCAGEEVWQFNSQYSCAYINADGHSNTDWLVTPKLPVENGKLTISFQLYYNSNGKGKLSVKWSTSNDVTSETWNTAAYSEPTGSGVQNSGNIEINCSSASYIYVAFVYESSESNSVYEVKNFTAKQHYTLTYDANGGTGNMANEDYMANASVTVKDNGFTAPSSTVFMSWNTNQTGGGTTYNKDDVFSINANVTLYAQWGTIHSITYPESYTNGSVTTAPTTAFENAEVTIITNPDEHYHLVSMTATSNDTPLTEYTIEGNSIIFTMPTNDVVISGITFEATTHTITYMINGAVGTGTCAPVVVNDGSSIATLPTTADISDYEFEGWSESETSINIVTSPYTPTTDITLYAIYSINGETTNVYQKLSSDPDSWAGDYLIVCVGEWPNNGGGFTVAFNGSLESLDAANNYIDVTINNEKILADETTDASKFTIAAATTNYSIKSASGYYIGNTGTGNGLSANKTNVYTNTLSISNGVATITASGECNLKFNTASNQKRFRYYGSGQTAIQLYKRGTYTSKKYYTKIYNGTTTATGNITITGTTIIPSGSTLNMNGFDLSNTNPANLVIEDGGQLICSNPVAATVKKNITNASAKAGEKWYAISSSVHDDGETFETIDNVTNLTSGTYDMFCYDEPSNTWLNQKPSTTPLAAGFSTMMRGRGYIYRNTADKELAFTGETNVGTVEYGDEYNYLGWSCKEESLKGFNLVGNPYPHKIYKGVAFATTSGTTTDTLVTGYYALEGDGSWTAKTNSDAIDVNQAILVEATEYANGKNLQFKDRTTAPNAKSNNDNIMFTVENSAYSDIAYAWFDNGNGLKKIEHRNANIPMLYINQDGTDYAIAMMTDNTKSFGLNFKAKTMGTYTLSYKAEGNFDYLHIIDRLTGEDVDMLMDGKYSFVGSPQDNAGRFIVKLGYDNGSSTGSETFVYQNGNDIIVDGEGTLEVFDVTGRKVMTTDINGVETINGLNTGVYIFRVIGETLRTQKIVVR